MPSVRIGFGAANYKDCGISFAALRVTAPFVKDSGVNTGKQIPGGNEHTAAGRIDRNKGFGLKTVEHPFGTILLWQAVRTRKGLRVADGAVFLRLREGAGLVNLYGVVPPAAENTCGDRVMLFSGNADVLTVEDCNLHSIFPSPGYVRDRMDPEEIAMCFDIRVISEGTPKPVPQQVETETGVVMREVAAPLVRRLRVRR